MIYQLAKTSPLLGGQVRLDMLLNMKNRTSWPNMESDPTTYKRDLTVADELHVVPIDNDIRFNEDNGRECLNYTHLQNIKYLYNRISDSFYSAEPKYKEPYWLYNEGLTLDTFDHTYEMGLKRNRYKRYNKEFSLFLPLWISEDMDFDKLYFLVHVSDNNKKINITKKVWLSDEIKSYLNDYYKHSDMNKPVSDNLLNIKFDPESASITGIHASSGCYMTKDISYVLIDLISRERPVLEFDSIILDQFAQNKIIAQQLLNLNLVFNLEDIAPQRTIQALYFKKLNIYAEIFYDGNKLPIKDFYTNYENIPAYDSINQVFDSRYNIFEYLHDNKYIDFMYSNKLVQPIFHWALVENTKFTYNFYDGFAPIISFNDDTVRVSGQYFNQANLSSDKYNIYDNNLCWCKYHEFGSATNIRQFFENNPGAFTTINFKKDIIYVNNNKFDLLHADLQEDTTLKICTAHVDNLNQVETSPTDVVLSNTRIKISDDYREIRVFSTSYDELTMKGLVNLLKTYNSIDEIKKKFKLIELLYDNWVPPYKIVFNKSLILSEAKGPAKFTDEIFYKKKDNSHYSYVYRYTGKICPQFIDINDDRINYVYNYIQWSNVNDENVQEYNRLLKTGYKPYYPSIDCGDEKYYALKKHILDINKVNKFYDDWIGDVSWFNKNNFWIFPNIVNTEITIPTTTPQPQIDGIVWNTLFTYIANKNTEMKQHLNSGWMRKYIYSLYDISLDFEYKSKTNINEIVYKIKFELK